jgi:predicted nucleic acid-binding protein
MIAALKKDEAQSVRCAEILRKIPAEFLLSEPSVIYTEVCGTLARRAGREVAEEARKQMDRMIDPGSVAQCDKTFCLAAYQLCHEYDLYAIDALYLKAALDHGAILVSLDKRDFVDRVKSKHTNIEAFYPSEFPY